MGETRSSRKPPEHGRGAVSSRGVAGHPDEGREVFSPSQSGAVVTGQPKPRKAAQKPSKSAQKVDISSNFGAMSNMVEALRSAGRLENVDAARIRIALHLAQMVDEYPENVGLWQQYRAAEAILREVTHDDSDGLADLFAAFDAEVRNAENGKPGKSRR